MEPIYRVSFFKRLIDSTGNNLMPAKALSKFTPTAKREQ